MPSRRILILTLIIALAIFFRFWQFNSVPPGLYQDEAMNGADAIKSLKTGDFSVFYPNNNGREGMIVWLDALAVKVFGTEPWVLRLFPSLAGVLAVLGLYFLIKELFGAEIALASVFFMAVSFWAVNFSRIGFRAGLMLPFLIWSFYFLLRGFKILRIDLLNRFGESTRLGESNKSINFIIAGILFGLGFYTYIAYRFAPVLALIAFGPFLFKSADWRSYKKIWIETLIFIAVVFLVALPIGLYFLHHPSDFFGRSGQVAVWSSSNPLKAVTLSVAGALGMFNVVGDFNWRHNFSGSPQLLWPVGILFLTGIAVCFKKFEWRHKFLLLWLFIFLLPNILSIEGNPHALRALGAMPAAMALAGLGLIFVYQKIKNYLDSRAENAEFSEYRSRILRIKKEIFLLLLVFLFFVAAIEFDKYFFKWSKNPDTAAAFSENQVEIADYLNKLPPETGKYVLWHPDDRSTNNGLPVSAQTVYFLAYGKSNVNYSKSSEFNSMNIGKNSVVIIPIYFDLELLHNLTKKFPAGKIEFIYLNTPILVVP